VRDGPASLGRPAETTLTITLGEGYLSAYSPEAGTFRLY
jgi:hypothetical protein